MECYTKCERKGTMLSGAERMLPGSFLKDNVPLQNQHLQWAHFRAVKYFSIPLRKIKLISPSCWKGTSQSSFCVLAGRDVGKDLLSEHVKNRHTHKSLLELLKLNWLSKGFFCSCFTFCPKVG